MVFLISAQIQSSKISDAADAQLSGGGYPLTSPNTILVLGSDARTKDTAEPGAQTIGQPSRSDSILLLRVGGGANAQLSILRDTVVDIPGHGQNKINAAYAIGGPALAIDTVEQYLGIHVNHLVEVNFENFPELIDSLGGITYTGNCVISKINGGSRNGGYTLRLKAGTNELDGEEALALARTRKNDCRPQEDDQARARRQQKIMNAIKDKVTSFETFIRLPWVSWAAPKAIRSDMSGPTLLGLIGAELIGGDAKKYVLDAERQRRRCPTAAPASPSTRPPRKRPSSSSCRADPGRSGGRAPSRAPVGQGRPGRPDLDRRDRRLAAGRGSRRRAALGCGRWRTSRRPAARRRTPRTRRARCPGRRPAGRPRRPARSCP